MIKVIQAADFIQNNINLLTGFACIKKAHYRFYLLILYQVQHLLKF
jgi:hypothetical protein